LALKFLLVKKSLIRIFFFFFFYVSMNENKLLAPRLTERHGHQTEQKKLKSIARETIRQGAVEEYLLFFFLFPYFLMTSFLPLYLPLNFLPVRPQVGEPTNREMDGGKGVRIYGNQQEKWRI
jgi:hypothetical protein